ncbi:MAG: alpha-mannosidase [Tannerella sp.]|jgi:alpha-mannosidase|nr:alpha-mannosidase [Tannerella sp.]
MMRIQILFILESLFTVAAFSQQAYFADGYHGGIYGHYPLWHTQFMIDQLDEHPDWKIHLEIEPETWDSVKSITPEVYARLKKIAADPRIEFTNPTYAQPYCFNISGESIIRQFEYGIRKIRQHFPDVKYYTYSSEEPCFTSALPQLLRSFGFLYVVLKNPDTCWGGYTKGIGNGLICWEGPDGTDIETAPRYTCEAFENHSTWQTAAWNNSGEYLRACFDAGIRNPVGMCYQDVGWKNGPWIGFGENIRNRSIYITWKDYFSNIVSEETAERYKLSQEDIQVSLMWGSQVLQRIAQQVRHAENVIVRAEKILSMASVEKNTSFPDSLLDEAWRTLMLAQHHDSWIVPYNRLKKYRTWADEIALWTANTDQISEHIIQTSINNNTADNNQSRGNYLKIYNTQPQPRTEIISVEISDKFASKQINLIDCKGKIWETAIQTRENGTYLTAQVSVPAFGYTTLRMEEKPKQKNKTQILSSNECIMENDSYLIVFDLSQGGNIKSLIAKKSGNKEFVDTAHLHGFNEISGFFYEKQRRISNREQPARASVLEDNLFRKQIRIESMIDESPCIQTITLNHSQEQIDFDLQIHWKNNPKIGEFHQTNWRDNRRAFYDDRFKLNVLFPLALNNQKIYKDAPFDVCESRLENTFYNTWDSIKNNIIVHWVDVVQQDSSYGMALLSDHTSSYSHGADFPLGLTLQYSGVGLWGMNYAITAPLHVKYALIPHRGKWDKAGIGTKSNEWNEPLIISFQESGATCERSFLQFDRRGYELTALKSEGGDLLLRIFNQENDGQPLTIQFGFPVLKCEEITLNGERLNTDISLQKNNSITVAIPRFGIKTLRLLR